jgi:hypothetical protein
VTVDAGKKFARAAAESSVERGERVECRRADASVHGRARSCERASGGESDVRAATAAGDAAARNGRRALVKGRRGRSGNLNLAKKSCVEVERRETA